jgi:hypothetical protein
MKTPVHLWILAELFSEWEMFQTKFVDEIKHNFLFYNFFWKSCRLWDNVEKYGRIRQTTDDK